MIWHGLALIITVATVMTALAFVLKEYYRKIVTCGTALFLWLAAAAGSPTISYPYTRVVENSLKHGVHHVTGPVSWLSYAWLGMAIIVALYLWYSVTAEAQRQSEKIGG